MSRKMPSSRIRDQFVEFFAARGHELVKSAPLIPPDDPTLLFTSAGMVPFKPYYLQEDPPVRRAVSVQRCLRLSDLEEVGHTPYHDTFFEMLGNFSFGDYFKRETIEWAWAFLTEVIGLPKDLLWISVYADDEAAADIWRSRIGVPEAKIVFLGDKDNFWGPAGDSGPCGPCSEIYFDMGAEVGCGREDCRPGCDCDRFFEVWNLVFPQFAQHADATREPLARPGIDTGMGLERLASVVQEVRSIFETDLFAPIVDSICREVEAATGSQPVRAEAQTELAVVADHVRAATFTIAENILPSNEAQGYVVRRLLRRAVRRGLALGLTEPFLYRLAGVVVEIMGSAHPHLTPKREQIALVIKSEEERFQETLTAGTAMLEEIVAQVRRSGSEIIPGAKAFNLYDTYGFPLDLTEEMASERGLAVDAAGFAAAMEEQRERGRRASTFGRAAGERLRWWESGEVADGAGSRFVGYDIGGAEVVAVESRGSEYLSPSLKVVIGKVRAGAEEGDAEFTLMETPFYAEAGGQVADTGTLTLDGEAFAVVNVYREGDDAVHVARVDPERLSRADLSTAVAVDLARRRRIEKNHTATHLLQAALREILGDHVHQSGSWVGPDRLRFDFTHFGEMTEREIDAIAGRVNAWIRSDLSVEPSEMSLDAALEQGAMALFDEKYADRVRCVSVSGVSMELCGGTHVRRTGEIGAFAIVSEMGVAAGTRRIEAVTGLEAVRRANEDAATVRALAEALRTAPEEVLKRAEAAVEEIARLRKMLQKERARAAGTSVDDMLAGARDVSGVRVVAAKTDVPDIDTMRAQADRLREGLGTGAGVLGAEIDARNALVAVVTDDLAKSGRLAAGDLVREAAAVMGGRGGGRPHLAQAGGGDIGKLDEALDAVYGIVSRLLETRGS